jgi:hypothetical protein
LGAASVALLSGVGVPSAKAFDLQISGFVRQEIAVKITGQRNIYNSTSGNLFSGTQQPSEYGLQAFTGVNSGGTNVNLTRPASLSKDNTFNQFDTRFELNLDSHLNDSLTAHIKIRGVYDEIGRVEDAFRGSNFFGGNLGYGHNSGGNLLEVTSKEAMLDLPSAYVDYNNGALWLRAGNQQIAWGEALFFRVADQVDGIDLRRHSVLGVAAEEYSDTRVPSPGLRGSYHFEGDADWTIEAYTQKFQPTVLPGLNTPYNPVASQFYIDDREGYDKVSGEMNFGARITGNIGANADYGVTAFAIMEHDPNGVFKWAASRNAGPLEGTPIPGTAFTINPTGVYSTQEWYTYAAASRLDGIGGLDTALNNFPIGAADNALLAANCGANLSGAGAISTNGSNSTCILDAFYAADGFLSGYLSREYPWQNVWGASINHIFEGEPDSFLDQLIARAEVSYTPHKKFTATDLGSYVARDEAQLAIILEKYYKFSTEFPATYLVGQYLHKTQSDIFGRIDTGCDQTLPTITGTPGTASYSVVGHSPKGCQGSNYVAFAFQQPSPTLKYRFDGTMLTDLQGGWLFQPGVKFKPSEHLQFDLYANLIYSTASENHYTNFAQGAEFAREIFARATYYF